MRRTAFISWRDRSGPRMPVIDRPIIFLPVGALSAGDLTRVRLPLPYPMPAAFLTRLKNSRIVRGISANVYSQLVQLALQLLSVPIYATIGTCNIRRVAGHFHGTELSGIRRLRLAAAARTT